MDEHVRNQVSMHILLLGILSVSPEQAYHFAKGENVIASNSMKAALTRPLDAGKTRMWARWEPIMEVTQIKGDAKSTLICLPMTSSPITVPSMPRTWMGRWPSKRGCFSMNTRVRP